MSQEAKNLLRLFLPLYAIHCMEQIYFMYGNVLQAYGISPQTTGWLLSIFFVGIMSMRPIGGWLLERFGIRKTLLFASALGFFGCTVLLFCRSIPLLFLGRFLSGASFGIYTMGIFTYQAMTLSEKMRAAGFAIVISGGILPMATITPIGEWLLLRGQTVLYLAMGPLLCLVCWYFGRQVGEPALPQTRKEPVVWGKYSDLLSMRPFLFLVGTGLVISLVDGVTVSISLFAASNNLFVSYFFISSSVIAVIVRVIFAKTLNGLPRALVIAPCGMLMTAGFFLTAVNPSNTTLIISGLLFGLGIGTAFPLFLSLISDTLPVTLRPKGNALALIFYDSGWFITPLIIGYTSSLMGIAWTLRLLSATAFAVLAALQFAYWLPAHRQHTSRTDA